MQCLGLTLRPTLSTCFPLLGLRDSSQIDIELMIPIGIITDPKCVSIVAKFHGDIYGRHIQGFLNYREGRKNGQEDGSQVELRGEAWVLILERTRWRSRGKEFWTD